MLSNWFFLQSFVCTQHERLYRQYIEKERYLQ